MGCGMVLGAGSPCRISLPNGDGESHAFSLPGHGKSKVQRPIRWCTLQYYFNFLITEVKRLSCLPVLMGHSMGGALVQWYLKYRGDLPAAVLIAPWTSHAMWPALWRYFRYDPFGFMLSLATLTATPIMRNSRRVNALITEGSIYTSEELYAKIGPESGWVLLQYNPPFWSPVNHTNTTMLWLAGQSDALLSEPDERRSAEHYGAEYMVIGGAAHNLMMERNYQDTAAIIHNWLIGLGSIT